MRIAQNGTARRHSRLEARAPLFWIVHGEISFKCA
jgi:hypothetical protein